MIITKTPFRISFVGGGSDLEAFYGRQEGAVLSTSINKYMYLTTHRYFEPDKIRVKYSRTETVDNATELQHPIFKVLFERFNLKGGIEASSIADIPAGTGMGSSSAFTVGLLHNLYANANTYVSKERLAKEACEIEIDVLKEPIGKQDQYATAFGGLNIIRFRKEGNVIVEPVYMDKSAYQQLQQNLLLFYIGNERSAGDILAEQRKNTSDEEKFNLLKRMVALVNDLRDILYKGDLDSFGSVLHENWILKQQLASGITNAEVDSVYKAAMSAGATGGKLLGAGGGGFMLFYCNPSSQKRLKEALKSLRQFDFRFEQEGSKIIYIGDNQ